MKRILKALAVIMALALTMTTTAMTAFAVVYTKDDSFTTSFDKNLSLDADSVVPNLTFNYTIEGTTEGAADSVINIEAGPAGAVIGTATFSNADENTNGTVTKPVSVDLSGVTFAAPGVYRYKIIEDNTAINGVTYDSDAVRYLDVYVIDNSGTLHADSFVLRKTADKLIEDAGEAKYENDADVKSSSYTNAYTSYDLEFSKAITGNQADKNKQFEFTLSITGANPGTYNITTPEGNSTITIAEGGSYSATYMLGDGESVTVYDLPAGAEYTVSEDAEDYQSSVESDTATTVTGNSAAGTMTADQEAAFTNTRDGIIPTGVILTVAPFAIGILLFGAVIVFLVSKRRRAAQ